MTERTTTFADFEAGVVRFAVGLSKKLLIANPIGAVADHLFALAPADLPVWGVWLAVICYAIQIYFDFSGYSDMAIGMARMFGFRFPENFNYPYSAVSIQDFWRRWHMTLSAWFRDYVYIPLGGSRGGFWPTARNLWIVFLLCGAWHGASWNFIIWGMWHGLFLSIERIGVVERTLDPHAGRAAQHLRAGCRAGRLGVLPLADARSGARHADADVRPATGLGDDAVVVVERGRADDGADRRAACFSYPVWPSHAGRVAANDGRDGPAGCLWRRSAPGFVGAITLLCIATMTVDQNNPFIYFRF